uniref:Dipeptidase n=1 Tax=Timema tahoe TaxID=61484 RepID=A0A7R9IRA2_9NEOP|nr:unnamed protein product [Timema tahoe]
MFQFWSAYVPCDSQYKDAVQLTLEQINVIKRLVEIYSPEISFATSAEERRQGSTSTRFGGVVDYRASFVLSLIAQDGEIEARVLQSVGKVCWRKSRVEGELSGPKLPVPNPHPMRGKVIILSAEAGSSQQPSLPLCRLIIPVDLQRRMAIVSLGTLQNRHVKVPPRGSHVVRFKIIDIVIQHHRLQPTVKRTSGKTLHAANPAGVIASTPRSSANTRGLFAPVTALLYPAMIFLFHASLNPAPVQAFMWTCPVASAIYGFLDPSVHVAAEGYFGRFYDLNGRPPAGESETLVQKKRAESKRRTQERKIINEVDNKETL